MGGQTQKRILLRQSEIGKDDHGKSKRRRMKESERKQKKSNDMMRLEEDAHHSSRCFKWCLTAIASPEMDEDSLFILESCPFILPSQSINYRNPLPKKKKENAQL
ncbi:hypothetical protein CRE_27034 [Caenorhabditis remanei]|uniref:Uncharacterized protein n=1 Tax=Caenorhabditis remanei TaxID=31234 RepID=E3LPV6_CAERE|nr:hypothetical protein CRE_27034 [Caenorhabditis remanei]